MTAITGNGTTIAFATTGAEGSGKFAARITNVSVYNVTLDSVEDNDINTTFDRYIPGDTAHHDEITVGVVFIPDNDLPALGGVEDITITYPLQSVGSTRATLVGDGFITGFQIGELANNQRVEGSLTFRWTGLRADGTTGGGPLFTKESA